jgi:hypothetical protein
MFDTVEGAVGSRLEDAARGSEFAVVLAWAARTQATTRRGLERRTRRYWHALNLPTAGDIRRVHEQLVVLDQRVQELSRRLDEPAESPRRARG